MHRGRAPAPHNPTIVERQVHGPSRPQPGRYLTPESPTNVEREVFRRSRLRPAAHTMHGGPSLTPQSPNIFEREVPRHSRLQPAAHDTTPAAAQQEQDQHPSTQAVDFSQDAIEPENPFTGQTSSVLKLISIKKSRHESLRNYASDGSIAATEHKQIGIATVPIPVNGPRNQHAPAPTTSLGRPSSLPRRAATATTHDLP